MIRGVELYHVSRHARRYAGLWQRPRRRDLCVELSYLDAVVHGVVPLGLKLGFCHPGVQM